MTPPTNGSVHEHGKVVDPVGLCTRTVVEYRRVLAVAVVDGGLDLERIGTWSASRRSVLKAALRWSGRNDFVVPPAPRARRRALAVPADAELERVEAAARQLPAGERVLVLLPLALGLRAQEALGLVRSAVQRAANVGELVLERKGGHEDRLPVAHVLPLLQELLATPARSGDPWRRAGEVLSPNGGPHTQYMALRGLVRRVGRAAGVAGLRPHLLRHSFATRMIADGAPIPIVQAWLGHVQLRTTLRYLHPTPSSMTKYVRGFAW